MTLDTENAKLFFKLFLPILDYVNLKCHVLENDEKFMEKWSLSQGINVQSALKTANKLWSDDTLIDDYLAQAQLSDENKNIVSSWKKHISGKFILERHLKKGSIFISMNDEKVYLVKGLNSTWSEMLNGMPPPVLLNATLLPWKDVIISDGLVMLTPVYFGKGYSTEFKEIYMNASKRIIFPVYPSSKKKVYDKV